MSMSRITVHQIIFYAKCDRELTRVTGYDTIWVMKCELCGRENLTAKELAIHLKYFNHKGKAKGDQAQIVVSEVCPDCGKVLVMQEGCVVCRACGYSKCG